MLQAIHGAKEAETPPWIALRRQQGTQKVGALPAPARTGAQPLSPQAFDSLFGPAKGRVVNIPFNASVLRKNK